MGALQSILHSVVSFEIVGHYTITVKFEDNTSRQIDLKDALGGKLLRALQDEDFFRRVYISEGIPTLTWPNGADFNPDHLLRLAGVEESLCRPGSKMGHD